MTKNELKKFQVVLDARQTELEKLIRNREGLTIETSPDELDRIQHATEREIAVLPWTPFCITCHEAADRASNDPNDVAEVALAHAV